MGARGHPKNLELLIFIIEWLILALYTTRLSASSRLACVESSHVSEYFENRVVDSKNGPFSGSHRRGGEEPGPIPWVGTFTPRNMIHIKIPSPDPLCPAHGVVKEVSTFHLPTLYIPPSYKNHLLQEPPSKLRPEVVLVTRTSDVTFFAVTIRNFSRKYRGKMANFSFPIEIRIVFQRGGEAEISLSTTSHNLFFLEFFLG